MDQKQLDELKALAENGPVLPLQLEPLHPGINFGRYIKQGDGNAFMGGSISDSDAEFVVAACNAVPALVAEVERLRAQLAAANEDAERLYDLVALAYNVTPTWEAEMAAGMDAHRARVEAKHE
jgi:hypothetical protein